MIKRILFMSASSLIRKPIAPFFLFVVSLSFLAACNEQQPQGQEKQRSGNKMQFACVKFDSAALEYHLDSIHIKGFTMQFYLPEAGDNNSAYQLVSYAFDTLGDYRNSWIPDTLRMVTDSIPLSFDGRVVMGNNELTREQINDVLNDANGRRISYDYILLVPTVEKLFNHLVYQIKPIKGNAAATGANGKIQISSPLPPSRVW